MSRLFGAITQNGYVVRDIEAAMQHWIDVLGVGPWYYVERAPIEDFRYQGTLSSVHVSIALANSGWLQIELIQQRNDAPSMYRDFLQVGNEGLQHIAYWTKTFEADLARALDVGYTIGQSGHVGSPGRFAYLATEGHPGTVVELSDTSGPKCRSTVLATCRAVNLPAIRTTPPCQIARSERTRWWSHHHGAPLDSWPKALVSHAAR